MIIGYTQENTSTKAFRQQIYETFKLQLDHIYQQVPLNCVKASTPGPQDVLVVSDVSCLGRTLRDIRDNLAFFQECGTPVFSLAEPYKFLADETGRNLLKTMDMVSDIQKKLASKAVSAALQNKKNSGFKLGRSKGLKLHKILDSKKRQIRQMLTDGVNKSEMARKLGVSRVTLYRFIREHTLPAADEK